MRYFVLLFFCSILFLSNQLFAQPPLKTANASILQSSFTQISAEAWGAGGAYIAKHGLPAAAFLNPAGLETNRFFIQTEFGKRLKSDYIGLDYDNQFILPGYAGIVIPANHFTFSFGFGNIYNLRIGDKAEISPTGSSISPKVRLKIYTFYASSGYRLNPKISFGLAVTHNYLIDKQDLVIYRLNGYGSGFGAQVGSIIAFSEDISWGINFKYNKSIRYDPKFTRDDSFNLPSGRGGTPITIIDDETKFEAHLPLSLQTGATYHHTPSIAISAMIDYQRWSSATKEVTNKLQLHAGVDFQYSEIFGVSMGLFTIDNPTDGSFGDDLEQYFLTIGITLKFLNQLKFSASVLDAHLLTTNDFQQTYIMAGLQFSTE